MTQTPHSKSIEHILDKTKKLGADTTEIFVQDSSSISCSTRLKNLEHIEQAQNTSLGLRVIVGKKQAIVSSNNLDLNLLDKIIEKAVINAKASPDDSDLAVTFKELFCNNMQELELYEENALSPENLFSLAKEAEDAMLSVKGVTNSQGVETGYSSTTQTLVTSTGFNATYETSAYYVSASAVAGKDSSMQVDYDYHNSRFLDDLIKPKIIGTNAGKRAVDKLNPKKISTNKMTVVFDPRVARSIISALSSAINGAAIIRGASFLKNKLHSQIMPTGLNLIDDPFIKRGLGSRPFDSEAIRGTKLDVVENGILKSWLLDLRSAQKLKLPSTGHALRSVGSLPNPAPSNLYLTNGCVSVADLISDIKHGVYVTETMGHGANLVTGDYSQGASGFLIENGKLTYPINEVTIASNLLEMLMTIVPANDLAFRYGSINSPTLLIPSMTVAGS
jgi:PmbA protein